MANTKISALTSATTPLAGTEVLPIVQTGATVKVASNDLTVRNVRANATTGILQVTGPAAASTRVMTVPDANFTAARTDAAQSFTGDQTLSTGNLVVSNGKGIDFSATPGTGTSELLNDYEEGTWTPVVYGSTTSGVYTLSGLLAYYTKIGNQVTVWAQFGFSVAAGGVGNVRISGLPFSYKASSSITGVLNLVSVNTTTTSPLSTAIRNTSSSSTDILYPLLTIDNSPFEQVPISGVSTSSEIAFTVTYTV